MKTKDAINIMVEAFDLVIGYLNSFVETEGYRLSPLVIKDIKSIITRLEIHREGVLRLTPKSKKKGSKNGR